MLLMVFSSSKEKLIPYLDMDCSILLLQEGVYLFDALQKECEKVYVLESDFLASGLQLSDKQSYSVSLVSKTTWVEMCAENHPIISIQ